MPDWRSIVAERLAGLNLTELRRRQISQELADHLEEEYTTLTVRLPEAEAYQETLAMLAESSSLIREIADAEMEGDMNQTTRALWLPGLCMLAGYWFVLMGIGALMSSKLIVDPVTLFAKVVVTWLVFGALGAYWAKKMNATRMQRVVVSVFPVLLPIAWVLIVSPISTLLGIHPLFYPFAGDVVPILMKAIVWPLCGFLLGALPFLRNGASHERSA